MPTIPRKRRAGARPRASLIPTDVLEERLTALEQQIQEKAAWLPPDDRATKAALWVVQEAREAIRQAGDATAPTRRAAKLSGWDEQTLQAHARAALAGKPRRGWAGLRVRRGPAGYEFVLSSIPHKGVGDAS